MNGELKGELPTTMTQKEFATLTGVSAPYITKAKKAGRLVFTDNTQARLDVLATLESLIRTSKNSSKALGKFISLKKQMQGGGEVVGGIKEEEPPKTDRKTTAKTPNSGSQKNALPQGVVIGEGDDAAEVKLKAQAEHEMLKKARAKIQLEQEAGRLLIREEVEAALADMLILFGNTLDGIGAKLKARLAAATDPDQCQALVQAEIDAARAELSANMKKVA